MRHRGEEERLGALGRFQTIVTVAARGDVPTNCNNAPFVRQ